MAEEEKIGHVVDPADVTPPDDVEGREMVCMVCKNQKKKPFTQPYTDEGRALMRDHDLNAHRTHLKEEQVTTWQFP